MPGSIIDDNKVGEWLAKQLGALRLIACLLPARHFGEDRELPRAGGWRAWRFALGGWLAHRWMSCSAGASCRVLARDAVTCPIWRRTYDCRGASSESFEIRTANYPGYPG